MEERMPWGRRGTADIGFLLNRVTRKFRQTFAEALAEVGLTPQQAAVVIAVATSPERRLTPRAVALATDTDQATTSGLLERLTRDGWLSAEPNPADGRSRLVVLTQQADRALPAVFSAAQRASAEATACLAPAEADILRGLLEKLCDEPGGTADIAYARSVR